MTYLFKETTSISVTSINNNTDAFNRDRISEPFTLGDYKHLYGLDPNFHDAVWSGGTITFQANQASARLTVTSSTSSRVVHQSKMYHHYMPGKSQLILSSFNFYNFTTGVVKRTGYFDDRNGIYLEQAANGQLYWVLRTYTAGSVQEERIAQSNWNADRCDGTGASEFNLDITKTQLALMDFQWLGVGRVRVGFAHAGENIVAHTFDGSNNKSVVYMSTPNLPVRCELINSSATTSAYFDQICSTVISEGGYMENGTDWAVISPSLRSLATGSSTPVMALALAPTFRGYENRVTVRMGNINVFASGENCQWRLLKVSSLAQLNGTWVGADQGAASDSAALYNTSATTLTGNYDEMDNGWISATTGQGNSPTTASGPTPNMPSAAKKNYIAQNITATTSEAYVVLIRNVGANTATVGVGLQWREVY
jgi:hypothetical protein